MQKMAQNQRGIGENQGGKTRRFCRFSKSTSENLKARIYQEKLKQITMRASIGTYEEIYEHIFQDLKRVEQSKSEYQTSSLKIIKEVKTYERTI